MACRERELAMDHIHNFLTTQGHGRSPQMSEQLNAGTTSETTRTLKTITSITHTFILTKRMWERWSWWPNDIQRPGGPKASWHCLTGEEKPRKPLTQETCPDRGSNPGPLRDRQACYPYSTAMYDIMIIINVFINISY